ncbi:DinB family protein [Streptomyces sp. NBC_00249]|uniref:DinB family protein n=1 Tax=Streptomyces sp. NBC_00249 TaxID=2975690 RepID=UPI002256737D|nr:DinB family protein [Streptomyces sp. NBC_00249]MCX5195896.1 DinB family protein [Streptomyces sp. NBC_00249]
MAHPTQEIEGDERGTLLLFVEDQRAAIRTAAEGVTEEQAASSPTVSALSLSGLVKHTAEVELNWLRLAQQRENEHGRAPQDWHEGFRLSGDETLKSALAFWDDVRAQTEAFVTTLPSLDDTFPLPPAPWFPKDAQVSVRWMLLHLVREFARHAGHADIIRETLDGTKAMG